MSYKTSPGRRTPVQLQKKLDEMERKHSLKELREKARQAGVSPSGTKRDIATRLFVRHAETYRSPASMPTTMAKFEPLYSWDFLRKQPYGTALWDLVLLNGHRFVVFLAREPRREVERLPEPVDVFWKHVSIGMEIKGRRVMPVVVLADVIPLQTVYEVWFNFYGAGAELAQEAFDLLGHQSHIFLFFLDDGPEPIRKLAFPNPVGHFFRGHFGMLRAMPAWSDADFNEAKRQIMAKHTVQDMLELE